MKPIVFSEGDTSEFESSIKEAMEAPLRHYEKELSGIRTGRATISMLDDIKVEAYGQLMGLKEVASLATPDARLLTVQPWDKSIIDDIEKAILSSDLGITPANDGQIIRLQLPMMSQERRDELIKVLSKKTEDCRIGVRNIRKEYHNQIREAEKQHHISEDFAARLQKLLQKITDDFIAKTDAMQKKKDNDLKF